jgi:PII-like signaling protein
MIMKGQQTQTQTLNTGYVLLRIYVTESDRIGHSPLHSVIVKEARELGIAGCTAIRGIMGYGASSMIHTDQLFKVASDLPVILELVDSEEKIQKLLAKVRPMIEGSLVVEEKVQVHQLH